jgi:hypothetical protein
MGSSAILQLSYSSTFTPSFRTHRPSLSQHAYFPKSLTVKASTSLDYVNTSAADVSMKPNSWQWKFKDSVINIYYEEHEKESAVPAKNMLMIPTISDVSTVEEWRTVAKDIVQRGGEVNWRATIIDWPGLGYSDRPKLDYNADVMEKFLVDFVNARNSPVSFPTASAQRGVD